ncbi:MAG TPA: hypothetical protein VHX42_05330 [Candidatus Babeliales bacterium]|nr:hypothetical protein [Candidatus Babeliales bacterium]
MARVFHNIDASYVIQIAQDHKVMLGVATSAVLLAFLIKWIQKLEKVGPWCSEKYINISTSVDNYTNDCIKECPMPVQLAITPIKVMIQFLCNAIKKYIAMNKTTIVYSVAAPVIGRLADCAIGCPIPFLNFTSTGWIASAVVVTKGYFDSNFEKVDEKLSGIETKIDNNQLKIVSEINEVKNEVGVLGGLLRALSQTSGNVQDCVKSYGEQLKNYGERLSNIAFSIINLEKIGQKNSQQLESIEPLVLSLRQELGLMKTDMQKLLTQNAMLFTENKTLQGKLDEMQINSDNRLDNLGKEVKDGFSRLESNNEDLRKEFVNAAHDMRKGQKQILSAIGNGQENNDDVGHLLQPSSLARLKQQLSLTNNPNYY